MSGEEIDWNKVAKTIVKSVGTEAARGLLYAFMSQTAYPLLIETISSLTKKLQKGEISEEEAIRMLREEIMELKAQGAVPQQTQSLREDELEKKIAKIIKEQLEQMNTASTSRQQTQGSAYTLPQPEAKTPAPVPLPSSASQTYIASKLKEIDEDLENFRHIRNEIMRKLYTTTDLKEKELLQQNLREIEERIKEKELERDRLLVMATR